MKMGPHGNVRSTSTLAPHAEAEGTTKRQTLDMAHAHAQHAQQQHAQHAHKLQTSYIS